MGDEFLKFLFVRELEQQKYIDLYNQEWDQIDAHLEKYITDKDKKYLPKMLEYPNLFPTYNSKYSYECNKLLKKIWLQHIFNEPFYVLKTKLYTAIRLFVTSPLRWEIKKKNLFSLLMGVYPSFCTGLTLLLGLFILIGIRKKYICLETYFVALFLIIYYWGIQIPGIIQSRYTTPIHLPYIMLITISLGIIILNKNKGGV